MLCNCIEKSEPQTCTPQSIINDPYLPNLPTDSLKPKSKRTLLIQQCSLPTFIKALMGILATNLQFCIRPSQASLRGRGDRLWDKWSISLLLHASVISVAVRLGRARACVYQCNGSGVSCLSVRHQDKTHQLPRPSVRPFPPPSERAV